MSQILYIMSGIREQDEKHTSTQPLLPQRRNNTTLRLGGRSISRFHQDLTHHTSWAIHETPMINGSVNPQSVSECSRELYAVHLYSEQQPTKRARVQKALAVSRTHSQFDVETNNDAGPT